MATELTPTDETDGHAQRRYPWSEWLNGSPWRLAMGEDFDMEPASFRTYLYRTAKRRGLRLVTALAYDDSITLQAYRPEDARPVLPGYRGANGKSRPADPSPAVTLPECSHGPHPIQGGPYALSLGYCASIRTGPAPSCAEPTPS